MGMRVKQFDAPFGVEVLGIDVANDVTDQVMGQLTSLLYQHRLLVLRAQHSIASSFPGSLGVCGGTQQIYGG